MGILIGRDVFGYLRDHMAPDVSVVLTHGCFDLLHTGHLRLLNYARSLGDVLVVGLNSDASVRELKGPNRPVLSEVERAEALGALWAVTFIVVYDELRADRTIEVVRPTVYVRGGDYTPENLVEWPTVQRVGARAEFMPLVEARSTSRLVSLIRRPEPAEDAG